MITAPECLTIYYEMVIPHCVHQFAFFFSWAHVKAERPRDRRWWCPIINCYLESICWCERVKGVCHDVC